MENSTDWKLKLRYGIETTPYTHFTVIADGIAGQLEDGFNCPMGTAVMSMKVWATDANEAVNMIKVLGNKIGFQANDHIEVYTTEAEQAPKNDPFGYSINFVPYNDH